MNRVLLTRLVIMSATCLIVVSLSVGSPAFADLSLLSRIIIAYNIDHYKKTLADGSYGGEEGILRLRPDVAQSLGLKVFTYQDYVDARDLFDEADELYEDLMDMMETKKTNFSLGHIEKVAKTSLTYNKALESAKEKLIIYQSKIRPDDQRLDKSVCAALLDRMLLEALAKASYNLRDALGYFNNRCQGLDQDNGPLTPENVLFVNHVFSEFIKNVSDEVLKQFDLDIENRDNLTRPEKDWRRMVRKSGFRFLSLFNSVIEKQKTDPIDPLLFLALMKKESRFDARAVSSVGAVGLTQIMPKTARSLGMKNIFSPPYFKEARSFVLQERRSRDRAKSLLEKITEENKLGHARLALELMAKSRKYGKKRAELYGRYKKELLKRGTDDRLDPRKAMEFGLKYFSTMMRKQSGDISLALASYNAGPRSVKKYGGIPPYPETVSYRNGVLKSYRYYNNYLSKYSN